MGEDPCSLFSPEFNYITSTASVNAELPTSTLTHYASHAI